MHQKNNETLQKSLLTKAKGKGKGKQHLNPVNMQDHGNHMHGFRKGEQLITGQFWQQAVQSQHVDKKKTVFGVDVDEY